MDKKEYRRVFGRQVAVDVPDEDLHQVSGAGQVTPDEGIIEAKTCDGELTIRATGKDCEGGGGWDDWAGPAV